MTKRIWHKAPARSAPLITGWDSTKFPVKRRQRTFGLTIEVPIFYRLVEHVISSIENDTLYVFRPDDEDALSDTYDQDGIMHVNKRADVPISIREWLCVGCQRILYGCEDKPSDKCLAFYRCNGWQTLFPYDNRVTPLGPSAFIAEIHLLQESLPSSNSSKARGAFCFVVAHELVHAFDMMRFVVPAFQNWRTFWKRVLGEGSKCDLAQGMFHDKSLFLDTYGSGHELALIEEFWPSQAKQWFKAMRGYLPTV